MKSHNPNQAKVCHVLVEQTQYGVVRKSFFFVDVMNYFAIQISNKKSVKNGSKSQMPIFYRCKTKNFSIKYLRWKIDWKRRYFAI